VEWKGDWQPEDKYQWVKESDLDAQALVDRFWASSGLDRSAIFEVPGEWRCQFCCWTTRAGERYLKGHLTKKAVAGGCKRKPVTRAGSKAERAAKKAMQEVAQSRLGKVICEDGALKNVFEFDYLGCRLRADGSEEVAPETRMAVAKGVWGDLYHIWTAKDLSEKIKLRIYAMGVVSILTYGVETWDLTETMLARLRCWNARCLTVITGRAVYDEIKSPTFDLVPRMLSRRLRWLGHAMRGKEDGLVRRTICGQVEALRGSYPEGWVLGEAPEDLEERVTDREFWRELTSTGDLDPNKKRSDTFMLANGYLFHNGAWIHSEEFSG
jgi:hypothetical protein